MKNFTGFYTKVNQCPLLHSQFKYRTRESEIEKVPIYTSRKEKLKRLINHKIAKTEFQ